MIKLKAFLTESKKIHNLKVYHGTDTKFKTFDIKKSYDGGILPDPNKTDYLVFHTTSIKG